MRSQGARAGCMRACVCVCVWGGGGGGGGPTRNLRAGPLTMRYRQTYKYI